jgi:transcriptional antiterminator RfaH
MAVALPYAQPEIAVVPSQGWLVVHTLARCEKKVREHCARHDITAYLPVRRSVRRYARRVVEFWVPLFPGYVFAQLEVERRHLISECRHVARLLLPTPIQETVLARELHDLAILERAALAGELTVRPEIVDGTPVAIQSGPLAGMQGIVVRRKSRVRLSLNIEMIGQSVNVEVDVSEVEIAT